MQAVKFFKRNTNVNNFRGPIVRFEIYFAHNLSVLRYDRKLFSVNYE